MANLESMHGLSGFTFIRNSNRYDFPFRESVLSMLPIVDELVICCGNSDDGTEKIVEELASAHPKIKVIHTIWDDQKIKDGLVLSEQTNQALDACRNDWCLYLQGDEVLHESAAREIREAVGAEIASPTGTEAFSFPYLHFYGGYSLIQRPRKWYAREIRVVRKSSGARSFGDAQTFRKEGGAVLSAKNLGSYIFHYGHARPPEVMQKKIQYFHRFWHGDGHGISVGKSYPELQRPEQFVWFWDRHPMVMAERIASAEKYTPTPEYFQPVRPEKFVVCGSGETAEFLKTNAPVEIAGSVCETLRASTREFLVDLDFDNRSTIGGFFTALVFAVFFKTRCLVTTRRTIPWWAKYFYNRFVFQNHENPQGFSLPPAEVPRQILRWMGL